MSKKLVMLVGPPGCGKSTYANQLMHGDDGYQQLTYINQDLQGKGHLHEFDMAILDGKDVVVDRMNFSKGQRSRYLDIAKSHGYETKIIIFHEPYSVCLARATARTDHLTIKDAETAKKAIDFFFKNYERVNDSEADQVIRKYPDGPKPNVIVCDLDGTLCDVKHRRHHVQREGKKNWKAFFDGIADDKVNDWCASILRAFQASNFLTDSECIVFCSGRGEEYRKETQDWLHRFGFGGIPLYMRLAGDSRKDSIVKEILLDFEILTRFTPYFIIDDRKQVVDMWRKRGYVCLQCDEGNF